MRTFSAEEKPRCRMSGSDSRACLGKPRQTQVRKKSRLFKTLLPAWDPAKQGSVGKLCRDAMQGVTL